MILENGLLVTLAFLNSKDSLRPIRDAMQAWLHDEKSLIPWGDNPPPDLADRLAPLRSPTALPSVSNAAKRALEARGVCR